MEIFFFLIGLKNLRHTSESNTPLYSYPCQNHSSVSNMAHTLAKTEQNIRNSSQVLDSKCEDGVRSHPTEQSLSFAKATAAKQPGDCVHRRSLLPKKTAPGSCGSTRVVPEDTQHTSAIVGSNAQVIPDAFSNPNTSNKFILSRSTQKKSQSASKAQKIPVKNLERSLSARNRGIGISPNLQGRRGA